MHIYFQGLLLGLAYVAPIGLQNLFVINTALSSTKKKAFLTALIVSFFDITLGLGCFLGIGLLMKNLPYLEKIILGVGSALVIFIGFNLLRAHESAEIKNTAENSILKTITTACVVTWFNPQAIIDGTMMLGAFRASLAPETEIFFISGFSSASLLWFFGISLIISLFSDRFTPKILNWINKICGVIIIIYGFKLLWSFIQLF